MASTEASSGLVQHDAACGLARLGRLDVRSWSGVAGHVCDDGDDKVTRVKPLP